MHKKASKKKEQKRQRVKCGLSLHAHRWTTSGCQRIELVVHATLQNRHIGLKRETLKTGSIGLQQKNQTKSPRRESNPRSLG